STEPVGVRAKIEAAPTSATTILVVEDAPDLSEMIREILENAGHAVLTALDGETGLATYLEQKDRIGLVLLDLTMPLLSGRAILRRILEEDAQQPVVVMSGYSTEVNAQEVLDLGARDFLAKPFSKGALLSALSRAMTQ
ncbi:MAG: response regulator, partial [Victivallales bacterium]|nr:response regulator [Victivallales bacterium]